MLEPYALGQRIADRRRQLKLTLAQVAERAQTTPSTVLRYEKGQFTHLKAPTIAAIARALEVEPSWLQGDSSPLPSPDYLGFTPYRPSRTMPILGRVAAGLPLLAQENIEGYVANDYPESDSYFALRVSGDSMTAASISDGDLVVVRQQDTVDDGEIAVVLVNGNDATVKRFSRHGKMVTLAPQSLNPIHQVQIYDSTAVPIRVIGRVMEVRKRF